MAVRVQSKEEFVTTSYLIGHTFREVDVSQVSPNERDTVLPSNSTREDLSK